MVRHLVHCYRSAGCHPVIVVVGGRWQEAIRAALASLPGVVVVTNPDPARGMLSSLQVGLAEARAADADAVCFGPVDTPIDGPDAIAAVRSARPAGAELVVAAWEGQPGHPARIGPAAIDALLSASPALMARDVLGRFDAIRIETSDPGVCENLNTPDEVAAWRARRGGNTDDGHRT